MMVVVWCWWSGDEHLTWGKAKEENVKIWNKIKSNLKKKRKKMRKRKWKGEKKNLSIFWGPPVFVCLFSRSCPCTLYVIFGRFVVEEEKANSNNIRNIITKTKINKTRILFADTFSSRFDKNLSNLSRETTNNMLITLLVHTCCCTHALEENIIISKVVRLVIFFSFFQSYCRLFSRWWSNEKEGRPSSGLKKSQKRLVVLCCFHHARAFWSRSRQVWSSDLRPLT